MYKDKRYMVLTNLIKSIRVDNHLTQVELAEKIKKAQSYISKYESGQRKLDIFVFNLQRAEGISMWYAESGLRRGIMLRLRGSNKGNGKVFETMKERF